LNIPGPNKTPNDTAQVSNIPKKLAMKRALVSEEKLKEYPGWSRPMLPVHVAEVIRLVPVRGAI
jgi:hypothetical protein